MPTSRDNGSPRHRPYLVVEALTAGYNEVPIVREVSIAAGRGEIVTVLGPNGAGKSTLLKAVMGAIPVSGGTVTLGEADVTGLPTERLARMGIGYVPQTRDVFASLTAMENLEMGAYLLDPAALRERLEETLSVFPAIRGFLTRPAGKLSGGERKMLAVGRVLMLKPVVLILDEPTAGLAPELSLKFLHEHVRRLAEEGIAVVLVEQKTAAALAVADWAYVLVSGRNRLCGPAWELAAREDFGEVFLGHDARHESAD